MLKDQQVQIAEIGARENIIVRQHPRQVSTLLLYDKHNELKLYNSEKNKTLFIYHTPSEFLETTEHLIDAEWNPGEDVFITLSNQGKIYLYAIDEAPIKMEFERQTGGISKVCWLDNVSGDFATSSAKMGTLRVWNAANPKPKDIIKVNQFGILNIVSGKKD